MKGFLLDTNVVSELVRIAPEPRVLQWVAARPASDLHLSSITLAELHRGVVRLVAGKRRERLASWIDHDLRARFLGRILPFDDQAAVICGRAMGESDRSGRPRSFVDAQIAAVASRFDLTLVTRNVSDFSGMPVSIIDPWRDT